MIFKSENLGTKPRRDILSYSFTSFLLFVCRSRKKMRILHSSCAQSDYKVNAERKSKVDDNTAKMQSIKWLGV